ncbi:sigma-70 family RNA polymerase sigma factor [Tundrisphaera sp. TA3]|uniref:sigma-70 family RNA polymerase sigma factor n=1 Tax=Tundrisphaera sp. TA3 TaxID=3435775 RepID=UPI003EB9CA94
MTIGDRGEAVRSLRSAYQAGSVRDWTDGQLLERFAAGPADVRDVAFSALIERHGPMVLGVCRGILGGRHDAEDAFQATFLVLVRQARGLWVRDSIGPWLHRVAQRTAVAARAGAARRARIERRSPPTEPTHHPGDDLARVVHEEVARLADRDRAVVVLCDLEGQTHEQAARALGWPVGSVKSRLSRARDRLRLRLIRRGLAPEGAASSVVGLIGGLPPAPAASLVSLTYAAAIRFAAGGPVVAPTIATALALGVLQTMTLSRLIHSALAASLTALALTVGSSWLMAGDAPQEPPDAIKEAVKPGRPEVPTVVARASMKSEFLTERGQVMPPNGVDVDNPLQVNNPVGEPIPIIWSIPLGSRVKKGDLLYRFDTSPLRKALDRQEKKKAEAQEQLDLARKELESAEAALREYKDEVEARRRQAVEIEVGAARDALKRAEARVKRYRDANELAARMTIDPSEPTSIASMIARLDLADRLDGVEADLEREKAKLLRIEADASKSKFAEDPAVGTISGRVDGARTRASAASKKSENASRDEQQIRAMLDINELRSPADGIVAEPPGMDQSIMGRVQALCRIITGPEPYELIRVTLPVESRMSYLKPGQSVLVKYTRGDPGMARELWSIPATFVELETAQPSIREGGGPFGRPGSRIALLRLASPLDATLADNITLEYSAMIPSGGIEVPARAVDGQRVAVRGEDGTFRWRDVLIKMANGDRLIVSKMLGDGEVIALDPRAAMGLPPREKKVKTPAEPAP